MLFVSSIEKLPPNGFQRLVTVVSTETGCIAGTLIYGDSVSDAHIRRLAPSLIKKRRGARRK
ncbi:hypothetical protein ASF12_20470 [Paenibacillus sp. Leaf72]|nr:hypothetical protein ASF12_20470 [Paenibacillus sp. Leaf72]